MNQPSMLDDFITECKIEDRNIVLDQHLDESELDGDNIELKVSEQ